MPTNPPQIATCAPIAPPPTLFSSENRPISPLRGSIRAAVALLPAAIRALATAISLSLNTPTQNPKTSIPRRPTLEPHIPALHHRHGTSYDATNIHHRRVCDSLANKRIQAHISYMPKSLLSLSNLASTRYYRHLLHRQLHFVQFHITMHYYRRHRSDRRFQTNNDIQTSPPSMKQPCEAFPMPAPLSLCLNTASIPSSRPHRRSNCRASRHVSNKSTKRCFPSDRHSCSVSSIHSVQYLPHTRSDRRIYAASIHAHQRHKWRS